MRPDRLKTATSLLLSMILILMPSASRSTEADASMLVADSLQAFYYAGKDMHAQISMRLINAQGKERVRVMTMLRKNIGVSGEQRYYIYFHSPSDIRGTSFMVWKHLDKEDDRWIFMPAIKLVRRIAADDKRSSFVGSDFTYEDVSGRVVEDETHTLLRQEEIAGRVVFVIESKPKVKANFMRRVSWIDQAHGLPLKEEFFDARDEKVRVFTANRIELVDGHWTITERTMENLQTGHSSKASFDEIKYDIDLTQDLFTERYLRKPPRKWIR